MVSRISSSVLCLSTADSEVVATAIVWDYTANHVLLLTNYHTWDSDEFRYCFPPKPKKNNKKRKSGEEENVPVTLKLRNENGFHFEFDVVTDLFHCYDKENDFAVLKLPKDGFTMSRIPVTYDVSLTLKIHAFGYIGHTNEFNVSGGEISGFFPNGFTMNFLSAGGYSGAAIVADGYGRAVGYMGGNLDSSYDKNSQHQSYAFRFDVVVLRTNRKPSPTNSPSKNVGSKSAK